MTHKERQLRRKNMASMVAKGHAMAEIAVKFGLTIDSVRRACEEHNVERSEPTMKAASSFEILAALQKGMRQADIAHSMNVSRQRVHQIKEEAIKAGVRL